VGEARLPVTEVDAAAIRAGYKPRTLRRAKERVLDSVYDGKARQWIAVLLKTGT
jgi:hypothetical protein